MSISIAKALVNARFLRDTTPMQEPLITRDMLMGDVVSKYPEAAQVMLEYGLHCVSCFANKLDTVEMGCKVHGMLEEEIQDLLNRVNDTIQKNSPNSPKV